MPIVLKSGRLNLQEPSGPVQFCNGIPLPLPLQVCLCINPLNAKLNPICHLLALLGAHPILHVSRLRVKQAPNYVITTGTTAPFEPRPSSEASASCPYSLQHSFPNFLASSVTPSSHLSFSLPLCLLPSTTATRTLPVALCSSIPITCPAHLNQLILMYVTVSLSLYIVYSSLFYFILHSSLLFVGPKIALKIFLSKTPKIT